MTSRPITDQSAIPALLRAARGAYAYTILERLGAAGYDDVPLNGPFVLGGFARYGQSIAGLIQDLEVSKQAASHLIDTLVVRGYLDRHPHPEDRRRISIELTERGRGVAAVVHEAIAVVDALLAERVSERDLLGLRRGLAALGEIRRLSADS